VKTNGYLLLLSLTILGHASASITTFNSFAALIRRFLV